MPCDVCSKGEGNYMLSTTQAITNHRYWEFFFRNHYPQQVGLIGKNGEKLGSYVIARAADNTGWALCESCIQMYRVDRSKARLHFQTWQQTGRLPSDFGIAPIKPVSDAAKKGWKLAFGTDPRLDLEQDSITGKVLGTYLSVKNQEEGRKKWWQFWKR